MGLESAPTLCRRVPFWHRTRLRPDGTTPRPIGDRTTHIFVLFNCLACKCAGLICRAETEVLLYSGKQHGSARLMACQGTAENLRRTTGVLAGRRVVANINLVLLLARNFKSIVDEVQRGSPPHPAARSSLPVTIHMGIVHIRETTIQAQLKLYLTSYSPTSLASR